MNKFNIKEAQKTLFVDSKNLSERGLNCDLPIMTIILVLLLDTLDYPTKSQAKNLSSSTIKLVRQLCQASSGERITVRSVNVHPQLETGNALNMTFLLNIGMLIFDIS